MLCCLRQNRVVYATKGGGRPLGKPGGFDTIKKKTHGSISVSWALLYVTGCYVPDRGRKAVYDRSALPPF